MSNYRRLYHPGGYYFFTLTTYNRQPFFNILQNVNHLRNAIQKVKQTHPFLLNALVILPDHLHCLWKLPPDDSDFSTRIRLIKRYFSITATAAVINNRKEKSIWQRRFWEHAIRNEIDWQHHLDYIHYNPVKHGLTQSPAAWPHSSFHFWVDKGVYSLDWGGTSVERRKFNDISGGE